MLTNSLIEFVSPSKIINLVLLVEPLCLINCSAECFIGCVPSLALLFCNRRLIGLVAFVILLRLLVATNALT